MPNHREQLMTTMDMIALRKYNGGNNDACFTKEHCSWYVSLVPPSSKCLNTFLAFQIHLTTAFANYLVNLQ